MISNLTVRKISKKLNKTKHKIQTNKLISVQLKWISVTKFMHSRFHKYKYKSIQCINCNTGHTN